MPVLKTVIADEQKLFLEGFKMLLTSIKQPVFNIIYQAYSGKDLKEKLTDFKADLVFMDLNLSDLDAFELISFIKGGSPETLLCVLTNYRDPKYVKEAFQKGADAYFLKSGDTEELIECVQLIKEGERFLTKGLFITPPRTAEAIPHEGKERYEDNFMLKQKLTKREQEVLKLIVDAKNNRQIAKELFISDQTVGVHRKNIMRKLGVKNTISLIKFAIEHSLI